jgi:hypothetical protein
MLKFTNNKKNAKIASDSLSGLGHEPIGPKNP